MMDGKVCTTCKEFKTLNNYYKESKAPDGLRAKCKQCLYFVRRVHRERNKEQYKQAFQESIERNPNYFKLYKLRKNT